VLIDVVALVLSVIAIAASLALGLSQRSQTNRIHDEQAIRDEQRTLEAAHRRLLSSMANLMFTYESAQRKNSDNRIVNPRWVEVRERFYDDALVYLTMTRPDDVRLFIERDFSNIDDPVTACLAMLRMATNADHYFIKDGAHGVNGVWKRHVVDCGFLTTDEMQDAAGGDAAFSATENARVSFTTNYDAAVDGRDESFQQAQQFVIEGMAFMLRVVLNDRRGAVVEAGAPEGERSEPASS